LRVPTMQSALVAATLITTKESCPARRCALAPIKIT
jgi:hypothetical protein